MKKLFLGMAAIALLFSSCNNEIRHAPVKAGQNNDEICEQFDLDRSCFK